MSINLEDLVDYLRAEVDPPGEDSFTDATENDWLLRLQSSFWEIILDGALTGYTETDGVVTPLTGDVEFSRELQQFVVFNAGINVIRNKLRNMGSLFRAKAGPVEYETQNSAQVMKSILDELTRKRNLILTRLSDLGTVPSEYLDMVIYRDAAMGYGDTWFANY